MNIHLKVIKEKIKLNMSFLFSRFEYLDNKSLFLSSTLNRFFYFYSTFKAQVSLFNNTREKKFFNLLLYAYFTEQVHICI